jgi:hypothetical protein
MSRPRHPERLGLQIAQISLDQLKHALVQAFASQQLARKLDPLPISAWKRSCSIVFAAIGAAPGRVAEDISRAVPHKKAGTVAGPSS